MTLTCALTCDVTKSRLVHRTALVASIIEGVLAQATVSPHRVRLANALTRVLVTMGARYGPCIVALAWAAPVVCFRGWAVEICLALLTKPTCKYKSYVCLR